MKSIIPPFYEVATLQDRVYRRLRDVLAKELSPAGVNLSEWAILGLLNTHKRLTSTEIASLLAVEIPYITRMLKQLEEKQLVESTANEEDKRSRNIHLTLEGKKLIIEIEKALRPMAEKMTKDISMRLSLSYYKALQAIDKSL